MCVGQLGSYGQIFMKFGYLSIFPKSVQRIQVSLKSDNNIMSLLLRMINASSKVVEEIKIHTLCRIYIYIYIFFFNFKYALYEIM
jgi:hypothetical protein